MRVLVAFEADDRIYQNAIASTLRELRPHLEVAEAVLGELKEEVARLVPDLVICDRSRNAPDAGAVHAWLKLPTTGAIVQRSCVWTASTRNWRTQTRPSYFGS